jgi:1,4-dihydroxy-2-naphthoate octaprenyltransferase
MAISSLFIGSMYPLTQIYQHDADKNDGVISLSYLLGYKGTFVFSGILFTTASLLLFLYLAGRGQVVLIFLFIAMLSPVIIRLSAWFRLVVKDKANANFDNTMAVNRISAVCMNLYFTILIIIKMTSL